MQFLTFIGEAKAAVSANSINIVQRRNSRFHISSDGASGVFGLL